MGSPRSFESDIEIQSALPIVPNIPMPQSPSEDVLSVPRRKHNKKKTKDMINQALIDLKSRKGVSLYAIKKYITAEYSVDTEKLNYHIKKYIKLAVEEGTIVQIKGIGASGSFKLVPVKEKKVKAKKEPKKEPKKLPKEKSDNPKNPEKKPKKLKEKVKKSKDKTTKTKSKSNKEGEPEEKAEKPKNKVKKDKVPKDKMPKDKMPKDKVPKDKVPKEIKSPGEKVKKVRIAKGMQTPSKKKGAMMKRRSIGSIIKPPKMKPSKPQAVK